MAGTQIPTVAVIGLGAHGLVAAKNLLEEGFDVTGFDRKKHVAGVWHYDPNEGVTALTTTSVNVSRERACFTDFAFSDGTSSYPTAAEIDRYLNDYCDNFDLRRHFRLGTTIRTIRRDEEKRKWVLEVEGGEHGKASHSFDKLVIATGPHNVPLMPSLPGQDRFQGEVLHSYEFKDPAKFEGKTVVVVGMGNTAVDTATILVGRAKKVYLSHRNGAALLPRILNNGTSLDHGATYRTFAIRDVLETLFPKLAVRFIDNWVANVQNKHFTLDPSWRINTPTPSLSKQNPTVSDTLYPALQKGDVISTHGPKAFVGPRSIELDDGQVLEDIDTVIFCTGYRIDLRYLGKYDPTNMTPESLTPRYDYEAPRLYRNIFSHEHPDSLAFIGMSLIFFPAFVMADLNSAALAQVWKHPELLPSEAEMQDQYARHREWRARIKALPNPIGKGPHPLQVETGEQVKWVQETAGTQLDEHLSYTSPAAWRLWWEDRELSKLLYDGIYSPHAYRLFDSHGRRKKWDGARKAILKVNADVKARTKSGNLLNKLEALPGDVVANT